MIVRLGSFIRMAHLCNDYTRRLSDLRFSSNHSKARYYFRGSWCMIWYPGVPYIQSSNCRVSKYMVLVVIMQLARNFTSLPNVHTYVRIDLRSYTGSRRIVVPSCSLSTCRFFLLSYALIHEPSVTISGSQCNIQRISKSLEAFVHFS